MRANSMVFSLVVFRVRSLTCYVCLELNYHVYYFEYVIRNHAGLARENRCSREGARGISTADSTLRRNLK